MAAAVRGAFIVAIEYRGADLDQRGGASRVGVLEHAYDVETAALAAHHDQPPRVGFPRPSRGWGSASLYPRCAECQAAVDELVVAYVRNNLRQHRPLGADQY
ncbi:MAG TPA: hypothetical protein VF612_02265 [Jatrophihabitans sp.]|jgi:hypothetical protein|uniref:hypothetical protein n=1 Tax=Jatrophihabitans sp. TaxID=1932789 RepID=UPI002F1E4404